VYREPDANFGSERGSQVFSKVNTVVQILVSLPTIPLCSRSGSSGSEGSPFEIFYYFVCPKSWERTVHGSLVQTELR